MYKILGDIKMTLHIYYLLRSVIFLCRLLSLYQSWACFLEFYNLPFSFCCSVLQRVGSYKLRFLGFPLDLVSGTEMGERGVERERENALEPFI